jgi:hypothetical protein
MQVSPDRDFAVGLDHLVSDEVKGVHLDRRTRRKPFDGAEERELRGKDQQDQIEGNEPPSPRDSPEVTLSLG